MRFGFITSRPGFYTHTTSVLDAQGKPVFAVRDIPKWWYTFGRPARHYGEDGFYGRRFYPLRVMHGLRI